MDNFNLRNMQLAYTAVYDQNLCESMEELGLIGEGSSGQDQFELWVNELLDEGHDLSDYTWDELGELYEGASGDVAARAAKLARQRKGQTPERKEMYKDLASKAAARERGPFQRGDTRTGLTASDRERRRESDAISFGEFGERGIGQHGTSTYGKGGITKNPRKLAQQKARGQHAESYELYNLVIGHLLDEGFADDYDSANMMIERMSDEWLNEILESKN